MNKVILFLKHGNPARPVVRPEVVVACSLFLLISALTAPLSHLLSTLCLGSAVLLATADITATDEKGVLLARRTQ
jgi:hypothetical protein